MCTGETGMPHLKNRTAVITGASRGIGEAMGRYFAAQGANVALLARSEERVEALADEICDAGGQAVGFACDVADFDDVDAAIEDAMDEFGSIDILINNAGIIEPIARLADSDPEDWGHVIDINVKGVYHGMRATIPHMLERGRGTIINISSGAAVNALEGWSHYCASKAAALMLTRAGDKEYRERGIRVIGLSPGTVATQMQVDIKASGINPVSQLDPSVHIPPDWVARAAAFLCGDGGDHYLGVDMSLRTDEARKAVGLPLAG